MTNFQQCVPCRWHFRSCNTRQAPIILSGLCWYAHYRKIAEIASRKAAFADETLRESGGAVAASAAGDGRESPTLGLKDVLSEALAGVLD